MLVQVAAFLQGILVCIYTNCVIPFSHVPSLQMAMFTTKYSKTTMGEMESLPEKSVKALPHGSDMLRKAQKDL